MYFSVLPVVVEEGGVDRRRAGRAHALLLHGPGVLRRLQERNAARQPTPGSEGG